MFGLKIRLGRGRMILFKFKPNLYLRSELLNPRRKGI